GFGGQAHRVQTLFQSTSKSQRAQGRDADRNAGIARYRFEILSLAEAVSWAVSDANRGMTTNSPTTGPRVIKRPPAGARSRRARRRRSAIRPARWRPYTSLSRP